MPESGLVAHHERAGESRADDVVAMVHGSMDRGASFHRARGELRDLTTLAVDRRGYGRSRSLGATDSLARHAEDLLEVLAGRPAVVVGHSYGGCVALAAATMAPAQVRALVVFESPLPWLPDWPGGSGGDAAVAAPDGESAAEGFLRRMLGDDRWEALPERAKADRRAEGAALVGDMRSIRVGHGAPDPPVDLALVTCPVVVGRGTLGRAHLLEGAERLAGLLPDATLTTIDGAAHNAHATHPAAFASLVREALTRA